MKKFLSALLCVALLLHYSPMVSAQTVTPYKAISIASICAERYCGGAEPSDVFRPIEAGSATLAYIIPLEPKGFIIISGDQKVVPVYAFSVESNYDPTMPHWISLIKMIRYDLQTRMDHYTSMTPVEKSKINDAWERIVAPDTKDTLIVWPETGTTSTGGWLETNWTQNSPYNQMCPMDLNAGARSIAGCPAVTMAQILNYLATIKGTRFGDADDYYHNYGSGNQFWIDNDFETWGFPAFDTLNRYLDTLENTYLNKAPLSNNSKAALTFACGTACTQVYTASGSGTFSVAQAAAAFQRFNFTHSRLVYPSDTNLSADLAWNIKNAFPAHLALVDPGETVGHNVVVDGYNTDEFFHFNFGWGGSSNGWYSMPPSSIPYNLTVIEGVVMDIVPDSLPSSGIEPVSDHSQATLFPNPADDYFTVMLNGKPSNRFLYVRDISGRTVFSATYPNTSCIRVSTNKWPQGFYLVAVRTYGCEDIMLKLVKD